MLEFILIFGVSLLGIAGHWVTRWVQGRTQLTFKEYLILEKGRTMSSVFSVISSAFVIYAGIPDDLPFKSLLLVLGGAYSSAYMLDSNINKEGAKEQQEGAPITSIKQKIKDDKDKNLDDLLNDDKLL